MYTVQARPRHVTIWKDLNRYTNLEEAYAELIHLRNRREHDHTAFRVTKNPDPSEVPVMILSPSRA